MAVRRYRLACMNCSASFLGRSKVSRFCSSKCCAISQANHAVYRRPHNLRPVNNPGLA